MTTQTDANPFKTQGLKIPSPARPTESSAQMAQIQFDFEVNRPIENTQVFVADGDIKKFIERKHLRIGSLEYERQGDDPGLILIFNQEIFDDETMGTRRGSRRDVNEIATSFQRQGFNVDINNIFLDFTKDEINDKLTEVANMNFANYNCLIIFFLSHGEEFNKLHTKEGVIGAEEIWKKFKTSKNLSNKPKMFVFQACKGENVSTTGTNKSAHTTSSSPPPPPPRSVIANSKTFSTNFLYPNMLIVYSSVEGASSFRNSLTGSWFIQEMCKNFLAYGKRDDVVSLIIRTTKCVCGNYYYKRDEVDQKQMPFFVSTLRKKFYLNRNKDRDLMIRIAESNVEILKTLKEVKGQLALLLDDDKKKKT